MNIKIKNHHVYEYYSDYIGEIKIYYCNRIYKLMLNNHKTYRNIQSLKVTLVNNFYIYIFRHMITISKQIKFSHNVFKFIYYRLNPEDDIMPMCGKCNYVFWAFIIRKYYNMSEKAYNIHNITTKKFNAMSFYKNICFFV